MLLARALILLAAVAALLAGFSTGKRTAAARAYFCPMHRQVNGTGPGECPICRMPLARPDDVPLDLRGKLAAVRSRVTSREIVAPARRDGPSVVSALLYDDEIAMIEPRQVAEFVPARAREREGAPPRTIAVRRTDTAPQRWDGSTSLVLFEVRPDKGRAGRSPANEVGWIQLATPTRRILTVPRAAVLSSPAGPYLLVASAGQKMLARRPVHLGRTVAGQITVVDGASEGERVVAADSFFIDAEHELAGAPR